MPRARAPASVLPFAAIVALSGSACVIAGDFAAAQAPAVLAGASSDWSVTIYRAPAAAAGGLDLDELGGFALITERRSVTIPAGESRIRFAGVADGIEAASAIITGLPDGVVEKDMDAAVLSPAALVAVSLGKDVVLVQTHPKTGREIRRVGKIVADAQGVVFQGEEGLEALRCSGLPERFSFDAGTDLASTPTLSTVVRSDAPVAATVSLSYLARGFDWTASYVATLSPDARRLDLGAWVTVANGNALTLPSAQAQVVAGRVNRENGVVEPLSLGAPILAECWPRGRTSDAAFSGVGDRMFKMSLGMAPPAPAKFAARLEEAVVTAQRVQQEQLGDLKLYRVPERTTVASRQVKQVRLLDRHDVPVHLFYGADLAADATVPAFAARRKLRTTNDAAHHLGLPLPSGEVAAFVQHGAERVLLAEAPLRDVATNEDFEIDLGASADVEVEATREREQIGYRTTLDHNRVDVTNGRAETVDFELRLYLDAGVQLRSADHAIGTRDGRPLFKLEIPARGRASVQYLTEHPQPRPLLR